MFFIQKLRGASFGKINSIPSSACMLSLNMSPRACFSLGVCNFHTESFATQFNTGLTRSTGRKGGQHQHVKKKSHLDNPVARLARMITSKWYLRPPIFTARTLAIGAEIEVSFGSLLVYGCYLYVRCVVDIQRDHDVTEMLGMYIPHHIDNHNLFIQRKRWSIPECRCSWFWKTFVPVRLLPEPASPAASHRCPVCFPCVQSSERSDWCRH